MKIIKTHELQPDTLKTETEKLWAYNGLDCCVTLEVLNALLPQLDDQTRATYEFSKELQAPVLDMKFRGVKIDAQRKQEVIAEYREEISELESSLERIAVEGLGVFGFNWRSNKDLQTLFYERLGIPVVRKKGVPTLDRNALEKLEAYFIARPLIAHLLRLRDIGKKVGMLSTEVDPDGRMRTNYSIGGTNTGRFSSSFSEFGTGTNLQNIEESLRSVFVADDGMKMAYLDEPQGESRMVGGITWNLFQDGRYLDACEAGDLHTNVAKLCWPDLGWTDDPEKDRKLAEQPFYRHYDYRFMCKKIGHGTNYYGQPRALSIQAKIDQYAIEVFQPKYFKAFPSIPQWHEWTRETLQRDGNLTTLTGRRRWFFGRREEDETLRKAIAYSPQGSLGDILNRGMLNVWRSNDCQLLMQIHDAILVQYPAEQEDEIIPKVLKQLTQTLELAHGRTLTMTPDVTTGFNWGKYDAVKNPDGLRSYKAGDQRRRLPKVDILDRILPRSNRRL